MCTFAYVTYRYLCIRDIVSGYDKRNNDFLPGTENTIYILGERCNVLLEVAVPHVIRRHMSSRVHRSIIAYRGPLYE